MSLIFLTLGLLATSPVHAQSGYPGGGGTPPPDPGHYWTVSYSNSPDSFWSYDSNSGGDFEYWLPGSNAGGGGSGEDWNGMTAGTVTATLTWHPAANHTPASDPPSEPVHIQEIGHAWEQSLWGGPTSPPPSPKGTVDDGLFDLPVPSGLGFVSQGTHLLQRDGTSGIITLDPVTMSAINPTRNWQLYPGQSPGGYGYYDWYAGECTASLDVQPIADPRAVTISSPIDNPYSYYKGNSQGGYSDQWTHQRTPYGGMAVDSAVAWHDASSGLGGPGFAKGWQFNNLPLTATPVNFLSQYPTYSWNLLGLSQGSLTTATSNPTYFSLLEPDGTKFPLHGTVVVRATDSDGFTAANFYDMTWHLPYEVTNPTPFSIVYGKYPLGGARVGPVYDGQTVLVQATDPTEIDWATTIDGATAIAAGSGQEEIAGALEILGNLAKVTNFKTNVGPEASYDGATNGPTTWGDAQGYYGSPTASPPIPPEMYGTGNISPASLVTDPNGWRLCEMFIFQEAHYTDKSWYADGYNLHGYDGNSQHVLYVRHIDTIYDEYEFVQYKYPNGSSYPGT